MSEKFKEVQVWYCRRCGFSVEFPLDKKPDICLDCGFIHFRKEGESIE